MSETDGRRTSRDKRKEEMVGAAVTASALPSGASTSALQTANNTLVGAVNETAPATDTASSGLNGRLQRIAQRITTAISSLVSMVASLASIDAKLPALDGVMSGNSSTTPLNAGATFPGSGVDVSNYPSVVAAAYTDQAGTMTVWFSADNTNWDSSITFNVAASTNEVHRISVTRKYCKVTFTNTSASNQTVFRLQSMYGRQTALTSALNAVIQDDADTVISRNLDFNLDVAKGRFQNHNNTIKSGMTGTISSGSGLTQDVSTIGGAYTGFPASAQAAEITTASAEAGTVYYSYMAASTDTDYTFASKDVTGAAGTFSLGHNIYRCNFAYFDSGSGGSPNVGNITIQSTAGPGTYKFCRIDAGQGESQCAAYTVPSGSTVYLDMERASMRGAASGQLDGYWWYRENGKSPRLRWPFETQAGSLYFDEIDYLQSIPALTDIIPRITYSSANSQTVRFKYRFVKVKSS